MGLFGGLVVSLLIMLFIYCLVVFDMGVFVLVGGSIIEVIGLEYGLLVLLDGCGVFGGGGVGLFCLKKLIS